MSGMQQVTDLLKNLSDNSVKIAAVAAELAKGATTKTGSDKPNNENKGTTSGDTNSQSTGSGTTPTKTKTETIDEAQKMLAMADQYMNPEKKENSSSLCN